MSIHRFFKDADSNYFHSSGYAKVAHGDQLGATSSQSFSERYQTDRNRKMVKRYHDSMVARRNGHHAGVGKIDIVRPAGQPEPPRPQDGRQQANASGAARPSVIPPRPQGFREPPSRGYNPYG